MWSRIRATSGSGNAMVRTLAAEVVTLMMRRMAEDTRLLQAVRDLVQGLKPVLLQVARTNPRFFADRENPARRLLDAMTSQGLAFTSEQDPGYAEFAEVTGRVIGALKLAKADLPERIGAALQRYLEHFKAQPSLRQGLAIETLARVEQRNLLAERVAGEIQARSDFPRAPGVVRRFLTGPWAQVVAHARLNLDESRGRPNTASRYMDHSGGPVVVQPAGPGQPQPAAPDPGGAGDSAEPARGPRQHRLPAGGFGSLLPGLDGLARGGLPHTAFRRRRPFSGQPVATHGRRHLDACQRGQGVGLPGGRLHPGAAGV